MTFLSKELKIFLCTERYPEVIGIEKNQELFLHPSFIWPDLAKNDYDIFFFFFLNPVYVNPIIRQIIILTL